MEQGTELFELAKQLATPEYVAAKIQQAQSLIDGSALAIWIALCALFVSLVLAIIAFILDHKTRVDADVLYGFAAVIAVVSMVCLLGALCSYAAAVGSTIPWENDPVTTLACKLAEAIS